MSVVGRSCSARAPAIVVLGCLVSFAFGREALAQEYPPAPIAPASPVHSAPVSPVPSAPASPVPSASVSPVLSGPPSPPGQPTTPTTPTDESVDVDAPPGPGVTGTIDTVGTSAGPGTEVLGVVVPNPQDGNLPKTGLDIGVLVAWGLMLALVGWILVKTVRDRQDRRNHERVRRESWPEVPFVDTGAFVGRYAHVGARPRAS